MANHFLHSQNFYILSGPSASGKSSLTRQLVAQGMPSDVVVSTDAIRKQILGSTFSQDKDGLKENLVAWNTNNKEIFNIIENILSLRFGQNLFTIFDATNLNDDERKPFVELANRYFINSHIIIFDTPKETLESRLAKRLDRFDFSVVEKQLTMFDKNSVFPHSIVSSEDNFYLLPPLLNTKKVDVLGDIHGLFDETVELLKQKQWSFDGQKFIHPDKERIILFLGDAVDRGEKSIEILQAIYHTVKDEKATLILGNHENKLISSYEQYISTGLLRGKSLSSSQTLMAFVKLDINVQQELYEFLKSCPVHVALWVDKNTNKIVTENNYKEGSDIFKMAFGHADNESYQPYSFPRSYALYGQKRLHSNREADAQYQENYNSGINEYVYVRGHIPNTSEQDSIYSLEEHQAFKGHLVCLDLENYIESLAKNAWTPKHYLFKENIMKQKSEFDFDEKSKDTISLVQGLSALVKEGIVTDGWRKDATGEKQAHPEGFKIYKYSKKVHFKRLWQDYPLLSKARGIALDIAGNIIVHPFDKLYNYGEYDTGNNILPEKKVQVVEKLNGFLGCITKHPFKEELLLSTTGSFNSPFTQFIADFIDEEKTKKLLSYFKDHNETLMFEVIHPEDKHIIDYPKESFGLWLIGAREKVLSAKPVTEIRLDKIGAELDFKRPFWYEASFKEVLDILPTSQLEGFMIRDADNDEPLMKIKTNYYLVTKFIGRMGVKNTEFMYKSPEKFKENHVDEEFYPIVDMIIKKIEKDDFIALGQKERVDFVRDIVNDVRNSVTKPKMKM